MNDPDAVFRALSHPLRRELVWLLFEDDRDVAAVDALGGRLAGAPGGPDAAETTAVLHHVHLPALEAAGVVEYDARSGAVRFLDLPIVSAVFDAVPAEPPASD